MSPSRTCTCFHPGLLNVANVHSRIVVLAAQLVNTGWISYRIARDIAANRTYSEMVVNGSCMGFDILSGSWQYVMFYVVSHVLWLWW